MSNPGKLAELREYYDNTDLSDHIERARWEDDVNPDPMVTTSLRLPKSLLDWVREQAAAEHMKPTALVRRWIEQRHDGAADMPPDDTAARLERLEQAVFQRAG